MANTPDLLRDEVVTGGTPTAPRQVTMVQADPTREYVSASSYGWLENYNHSLNWAIDDLTEGFGSDLYERMLLDAQVNACVSILRSSILEDGVRLAPAVSKEGQEGYDQSAQTLAFCERVLSELETPLDDVLWNLMDAIALGNKVAELIYETDDARLYPLATTGGVDVLAQGPALILRAIKVRPRESTAFVVDAYNNILGLLARMPGQPFPVLPGAMFLDLKDLPNFLPREKFAILSWRPRDGDPRGTSILRAAYDPWYRKVQMIPEHLKYLTQWPSPIPIGYLPPDAMYEPTDDAEGNPTPDPVTGEQKYSDPATDMANALATIRNGAALSFPNGSEVQLIQSANDGGAFLSAFDEFNREITKAILTVTLATEEGQHQARAAAAVHQDSLDTIVRQGKKGVVHLLRHQILRRLVRYNFGPDWERWTPQVSLGNSERRDLMGLLNSLGIVGYYLDPSQFPGVDAMTGMPVRTGTAEPAAGAATSGARPGPPTRPGAA